MEEINLKAMTRIDTPKKVRAAGYIPGVLNDSDTTSKSVMFEASVLNKIIAKHGSNAKMWIELDGQKNFGYIMEVQKHPVENRVIHVSIKLLQKGQEVKVFLPIQFHGVEELTNQMLELQVYKPEIEVMGVATDLPDVAVVNVSERVVGDHVTIADMNLDKAIKVLDSETEIYAFIRTAKVVEEELEEVKEVETAAV